MIPARMRRLASDWEQVKKDFSGHKNIIVTPVGEEPYEKYNVTYFVNGIYLDEEKRIQVLGRHEVEIILHSEYPRYKPICKIKTPIWHPNFRDGQICIGDIWGAGESLSDIIINIGDMIQYKSWNSYSPLSAEAAQWAIENKHLFPVGNIELYKADYSASREQVDIELFDDEESKSPAEEVSATIDEQATLNTSEAQESEAVPSSENHEEKALETSLVQQVQDAQEDQNDFDITAEELQGIEFVPSAQRMQTASHGGVVKGKRINFKTVFVKGIIWGLIGGALGWLVSELLDSATDYTLGLKILGYNSLYDVLNLDTDLAISIVKNAIRISTGFFSAILACGIGMFMGIGEGVYYGSGEKAVKYGGIGAAISLGIGFVSGYLAQFIYAAINTSESQFTGALVRGLGWAIMGLGVGLAVGLIKPEKRRMLFCSIGGFGGGFAGGFLFEYIVYALVTGENDTGTFARAIAIIIMGLLIGLGIGLLEQFAKEAWLKVVRGEFEGKEYLVFNGVTSIGNTGKNTIVLFKDKLVGPHHCDIVLEGSKYVLVDMGTPMGTFVNGQRITRHVLKQGDAIALGNSVLVFNLR